MVIFNKFVPNEDKIKALSKKLMEEPLYLSDEYRDWKLIHEVLFKNFSNKNNIFYEMGAFGGLIGFVNICPKFKCGIVFKLWNKDIWGTGCVKEIKQLIKTIMEKYDLKRVEVESADEKMVKAAKVVGFKVEGRFKYAFMWEKKMYTLHKMRILEGEL